MIFVWGQEQPYKDRASVTLSDPIIASRSISLVSSDQNKLERLSDPDSTPDSALSGLSASDSTPQEASALSNIPKYFKQDLQQIFKTILEAKTPIPALPSFAHQDESRKKSLKARSPDLYCGKSHRKYYNFYQ